MCLVTKIPEKQLHLAVNQKLLEETDGPNGFSVSCREWDSAGSKAEHPCSIL